MSSYDSAKIWVHASSDGLESKAFGWLIHIKKDTIISILLVVSF